MKRVSRLGKPTRLRKLLSEAGIAVAHETHNAFAAKIIESTVEF